MNDYEQEREKHSYSGYLVLELPDKFDWVVPSPFTTSLAHGNEFYWEVEHMEMFGHERFPVFCDTYDMSRYNTLAVLLCGEPEEISWYAAAAGENGALDIRVETDAFGSCRYIQCTELTDAFLEDILAAAEAFYGQSLHVALKTDINHDGSKRYLLTLRFSDKSTPD